MTDTRIRIVLAVVVTLVLGGAIVGIGQGGGGGTTKAAPASSASVAGRTAAVRALGVIGTRGRDVFTSQGCGGCHTLADAKTRGQIGPDLDAALSHDDLASIRQSIVDPGAEGSPGYPSNIMPDKYGSQLSAAQLDDLVRYVHAATQGG